MVCSATFESVWCAVSALDKRNFAFQASREAGGSLRHGSFDCATWVLNLKRR